MRTLRAQTKKPTHPGAILREDVLPELKLSQTEISERLGVSRRTVSEIVHEHRPVTADMAIRLARFLGGTPNSWLNMQQALDLWLLQNKKAKEYSDIRKYG